MLARTTSAGAELVVRDEGPGLPDDHDIFVPFSKGSASLGHGLGLHVVRTLVEAMGGEVTGHNVEGRGGAEFVVSLRARRLRRSRP
ncbi:ATP-binding protein [Tessaracoccus sp. HDW20]|nr:ATP-binding protein [Tessaracoccus coleopterorum]